MGERIRVTTVDGPAEAYLTGSTGDPGVLFYVDAIGLRPRIEEMADRIASWGYVVLAPHVFHRSGSAEELAPTGDLRETGEREAFFATGVMDRVHALTPDLAESDAAAWVLALAERAGDGPFGTTGYCMGARLAMRTAGWYPGRVRAVGGFHGAALVTGDDDSPHLALATSVADHVFLHADADRAMPPEAVAALGDALEAAGRPYLNEVAVGAAHGYTMADTSVYDEAATERHFTELRTLFDRTL